MSKLGARGILAMSGSLTIFLFILVSCTDSTPIGVRLFAEQTFCFSEDLRTYLFHLSPPFSNQNAFL